MVTNENKIITQGECNKISPPITVFSGTLTKCPTKSEINSTKKKIVLEAGVNSNRKNITSSYKENQLVRCPDVGHYVICTHDGTIMDIPYIEFLYNNQVVESFYPFTEQGVTGNEISFVLGLTSDFFEYDWSQMTIRASFGNKTNSLSYYKLNGYSGEKNSEGTYFIWNTTYANNILDGLINHNLDVFVNENSYGTELEITPSTSSIYVGNTTNFKAVYYTTTNGIRDDEGVDVTSAATWITSAASIATVSNGVVTGKGEGDVEITATYNGISESVTINVANYISINPTALTFIALGEVKNVTVSSSSSFNVSEGLDWLTYTTNGNTVSFTASENQSTNARSGSVTFTCGSKTTTLSVSQSAATVSYDLEISPKSNSIAVGGTVNFTAIYYEYRNNKYYTDTDVTSAATWTTSAASIATVSNGVVTGKGEGSTTIYATYNRESDSATVSVSTYISINPTNLVFIAAGESKKVTVSAPGPFEVSENLEWLTYTTNGNVVTFTASENTSTSVRSGKVTFTCGSEVVELSVSQEEATVSYSLYIEPSSGSAYVGETIDFTAYYYEYRNGDYYTDTDVTSAATWSSSATSIATVSKGVVTGKGEGSTTIYATYNGESDSATVSVSYPALSFTVSPTEIYLNETGDTGSFTVSASNYASISASKSGSWFTLSKTSGTGTYTVSANVNPNNIHRTGSVTVTCVGLDGTGLEKTVDVTQYASEIGGYLIVSPSATSVNVGSSVSLEATYYFTLNGNVIGEDDVTSAATWISNSESNATVSSGVVNGITGGTATITATFNSSSDSCDITVNDVYTYNFYISTWTTPINAGDTRKYKGFLETKKNGVLSTSEITTSWKSSNTSVATISSGGIVTGLKSGTTTITGTATLPNGNTATNSRNQVVNSVEYSLDVSPSSITIEVGETYQLAATYYTITNGVSDSGIDVTSGATWGSGSATYVSVNGSGLVTGEKNTYENTFNITATYNGKSDKCGVIVTASSATLTSLSVNSCYGAPGTYSDVYVTATYSDGSIKNVTSDCTLTITDLSTNGVATISGNQVQHGNVGTATLNASYTENGITKIATASVTTVPEVYVTAAYVEQINEGTKSTIRLVLEMNDGSTIYPSGSYKIMASGTGGPTIGTGGSIPMTFDTTNGTIQGGIEMTTGESYYEENGTYGTITRQGGVYLPIVT